jgi:hypothetical protein
MTPGHVDVKELANGLYMTQKRYRTAREESPRTRKTPMVAPLNGIRIQFVPGRRYINVPMMTHPL